MALHGILICLPVSEATMATVVFGARAHQCEITDIVTSIVVAQEMFVEVVCPIVKPVEDEEN